MSPSPEGVDTVIDRLFARITDDTKEMSRDDYIYLLEELKDDIETRLDAAQEDEAREQREKFEAAIDAEDA
jgi:hypothetical protein